MLLALVCLALECVPLGSELTELLLLIGGPKGIDQDMGHRFHTNEETAGTRSRELKAAIARELMKRIEACGRRHRTETCPKIDGTDESIASLAEVTEAVCVDCANLKEVLAVCGISSEQFSRAIQKAIQMLAKAVPEGPDHPSWQALLPAYTEGVLVLIIPDA